MKINLLTTNGPASVSLLYKEMVGCMMTESEFVESMGFSFVLPGSDALKLAIFAGYSIGGIPGALAALLGSIVPPTVVMLIVLAFLGILRQEPWIDGFIKGLGPAVSVLMVIVAWQVLKGDLRDWKWQTILLAASSLVAFMFDAPTPLVLLLAGLLGILLYR